jgi:DNA/RNA endonuclease YhcR with UshA esterase domain
MEGLKYGSLALAVLGMVLLLWVAADKYLGSKVPQRVDDHSSETGNAIAGAPLQGHEELDTGNVGQAAEVKASIREATPTLSPEIAIEKASTTTPSPALQLQSSATATATLAPTLPASSTPTPAPSHTLPPTALPSPTETPSPTTVSVPSIETRTIGSITPGDRGKLIGIAAAGISEVDYFSKGVKYTLTDGSGEIILLVWQNVMEEISGRYDLFPGSQVQVMGEIEVYDGDLEIIPRKGANVVVLDRGDRPPIEERAAGKITPSDEGRIFAVSGIATRTESDGWLKMWLNDGSGEILIFVPGRTVEYLPQGIAVGCQLRVIGEVDIYQGVIEIIPRAGIDVELR